MVKNFSKIGIGSYNHALNGIDKEKNFPRLPAPSLLPGTAITFPSNRRIYTSVDPEPPLPLPPRYVDLPKHHQKPILRFENLLSK